MLIIFKSQKTVNIANLGASDNISGIRVTLRPFSHPFTQAQLF